MRRSARAALWRGFSSARAAGLPAEEGARLLEDRFGLELVRGAAPWSWTALERLWQALAPLPDFAVRDNPHLVRIARAPLDRQGAYHDCHTRSPLGPGSAELRLDRLTGPSREYRVPISRFCATVRHEVGHAVAVRLGLHDTLYREVPQSPWIFGGSRREFLLRLFGPAGGPLLSLGELYLAQPAGRTRSMGRALARLREEARRRGRPLPGRALLGHAGIRQLIWNCRMPLPCYGRLRPDRGLIHTYDSGYQRGFIIDARGRLGTRVSDYQFRTPNEWFAEIFAVYYADCDEGRRPGSSLRRLSWRLAEIAAWLDRNVEGSRGGGRALQRPTRSVG